MKKETIDFDFYDDGVRKKPTRRLCIEKGEKSVRITSLFLCTCQMTVRW